MSIPARPPCPKCFRDKDLRLVNKVVIGHHHPILVLIPTFEVPLSLALVHPYRRILIDSILSRRSMPTPTIEGSTIVGMNLHHIGAMQHDPHATIRKNFRIGVVAHLTRVFLGLAVNHLDSFKVCHLRTFQ